VADLTVSLRGYVIVPAPTNPVLHLRSRKFRDETLCGLGISVKRPTDEQLDWRICERCEKRWRDGR
jgi:hypothetical protein